MSADIRETAPGRAPLPIPAGSPWNLAQLVPRRDAAIRYRMPSEMGPALSLAADRLLGVLAAVNDLGEVAAPSELLSPPWHRIASCLRRAGVIHSIRLSDPFEDELPLYHFDVSSPFHSHLTDGGRPATPRFSRGFSEDYDMALSKALGECLERTPWLYYRAADLMRASATMLERRKPRCSYLSPRRLAVFNERQMALAPALRFDEDTIFAWVRGTSLTSGEPVFLPAQLVYWNYSLHHADVPEPMLRERSTHGAAGGFTRDEAVLSAVYEWIQRDGFFLWWLAGASPPRIRPDGIPSADAQRLIASLGRLGYDVRLLDVTSELGIPTCVCALVRGDGSWPCLALGAGCSAHAERAVVAAVLEAASVHHTLRTWPEPFALPNPYTPFSAASISASERVRYWAAPENLAKLSFLFEGGWIQFRDFARRAPRDRKELRFVLGALARCGFDAYVVEADHPALDKLRYASVRVIVPDMIPLYYQECHAPLALPRVGDNYLRRSFRGSRINEMPHPFP